MEAGWRCKDVGGCDVRYYQYIAEEEMGSAISRPGGHEVYRLASNMP